MKKFLTIILSGLFGFILSCELVVDVDIPLKQQQLVVNSFFNPDSLFEAHVSLNRHVLDDAEFININNAQVGIYKDNLLIEELVPQGNGHYKGMFVRPLIEALYEIKVTTENYGVVQAQSLAPEKVSIDLVEIGELAPDQYERSLKLSFTDRPNEKNYYQLLLLIETSFEHWETGELITQRYPAYFTSDDPSFANNYGYGSEGLIFNDLLFDGKQTTLPAKVSIGQLNENNKLIIVLRTVSEDFYNYVLTASLQSYNYGNPFAQPVQVFNNIENGFGVFAGYSQDVYEWQD